MQKAASVSEINKPRSLVQPRGQWQSRSSPALAAAFNLRKYAIQVKHIPPDEERPASAPADLTLTSPGVQDQPQESGKKKIQVFGLQRAFGAAAQRKPIEPHELTENDLLGGNGNWRKMAAEEEFKRRREEQAEKRRQDLIRAAEKKRKEVEQAERRRRRQQEEENRWAQERQQKEIERQEKERVKREKEEAIRLQKEQEEEERRRRMPKTCETCYGSAKCQECGGKGFVYAVFLVGTKSNQKDAIGGTKMDHGRKEQGCEKCGGYSHNLLGDIKMGSGKCAGCQGLGKIWPIIEDSSTTSPSANSKRFQLDRSQDVKL